MHTYTAPTGPTAEPIDIVDTRPTRVAVDGAAFELLQDVLFLKKWDQLYETCAWATAFQSPDFAQAWYTLNQAEYMPVIVTAEADGELVGLLAMALLRDSSANSTLRNKRPRLVAVGNYEAEYQAWIATPAHEAHFVKKAFSLLQQHFRGHDIFFRFIPNGVNTACLRNDPDWENACVWQRFRRPLMEMNNPEVLKLFKKRGFKLKLNRLKRLGNVQFEHITDLARFLSFYDQLTLQYDFRQGAMFNKNHFKDAFQRKALLIELFKHNLLHTTVLSLNGEIIASIVAVAGKNWVHLGGINTHSPFYAAHSPGFVHFLSLGQLLASEQSATVFDLTPGGDAYKERMATGHDEVYELMVTPSKTYRLRRQLRRYMHDKLVAAGHRPMSVELGLKRRLYLLRARLKGIIKGQMPSKLKLVTLRSTTPLPAPGLALQTNSLSDLLCHEPGGGRTTRWEFLEEAMRRFEEGQQAYTLAHNGRLLCCAWLPALPQEQTETMPPPRLLELNYCQPDFAARLPDFVASALALADLPPQEGTAGIDADLNDAQLQKALGNAGFQRV